MIVNVSLQKLFMASITKQKHNRRGETVLVFHQYIYKASVAFCYNATDSFKKYWSEAMTFSLQVTHHLAFAN